jgi:hypothetical protein
MSAAGVITGVPRTGTAGYSGDDGAATEAELNWPARVAVTAGGQLRDRRQVHLHGVEGIDRATDRDGRQVLTATDATW